MPLVKRTRATLRSAELGFLGVVVCTRVQTPRRWGAATFFLRPLPDFRPGVSSFFLGAVRPLRINCDVVGMRSANVAGRSITPRPSTWPFSLDRLVGYLPNGRVASGRNH